MIDWEMYEDRQVHIYFRDDTPVMDCKIVKVSPTTIMVYPKGKSTPILLDASSILEILSDESGRKEIKQRVLRVIELGGARAHLAMYHGAHLDWLNEVTEDAAFNEHDSIAHDGLGHAHSDADPKVVEDANAA